MRLPVRSESLFTLMALLNPGSSCRQQLLQRDGALSPERWKHSSSGNHMLSDHHVALLPPVVSLLLIPRLHHLSGLLKKLPAVIIANHVDIVHLRWSGVSTTGFARSCIATTTSFLRTVLGKMSNLLALETPDSWFQLSHVLPARKAPSQLLLRDVSSGLLPW